MRQTVIFLLILLPLTSFAQEDGDIEFVVKKKEQDTATYINAEYCGSLWYPWPPLNLNNKREVNRAKKKNTIQVTFTFLNNGKCLVTAKGTALKVPGNMQMKEMTYYILKDSLYISGKPNILTKGGSQDVLYIQAYFKGETITIPNQLNTIFMSDLYYTDAKDIVLVECTK